MPINTFESALLGSQITETIMSFKGVTYTICADQKHKREFDIRHPTTGKQLGKALFTTYRVIRQNVTLMYLIVSKHPQKAGVKVFATNNPYATNSKTTYNLNNPTKNAFLELVRSLIDIPHPLIARDGKIDHYPETLLDAIKHSLENLNSNGVFCVSTGIADCNGARLSAMKQLRKVWGLDWLFRDCETYNKEDESTIDSVSQYLAATCVSTIAFSVAGCLHIPDDRNPEDEKEKICEFAKLLDAYKLLLLHERTNLIIAPNNGNPIVSFENGSELCTPEAQRAKLSIERIINNSKFLTHWTQIAIKGRDDLSAIVFNPNAVTLDLPNCSNQ